MARAHSVWLVGTYNWDGFEPEAAFTVKHELATWLRRKRGNVEGYVRRYVDGAHREFDESKDEQSVRDFIRDNE